MPNTEILDLQRLLLSNLFDRDNFTSSLLEFPELPQEIPETRLGDNVVSGENPHPVKRGDSALAETVTKLAHASKEADGILKKVKYFENKSMNSEVELEEGDKNLRETTKMASDNEQKLDELTRKLGVQEDECKRATDRAELAEGKLKDVEQEL